MESSTRGTAAEENTAELEEARRSWAASQEARDAAVVPLLLSRAPPLLLEEPIEGDRFGHA